jgi:hypothetical protein
MWYPPKDYSLAEAKDFLEKDFLKVIKRTKYLYVERKPRKNIGYGFFEPILLCMSWCDFLGALYCGSGKEVRRGGLGSTKRSKIFIEDVLGEINTKYKTSAEKLIKIYRHGTVHAYAPFKCFHIEVFSPEKHLEKSDKKLIVSIDAFLTDLIAGTRKFKKSLHLNSTTLTKGSLLAFNKGRIELE